ncbi:vWA domain-containing protein [Flavicella sediminum]|uniref:hypothetical protein n=1 Tax=Flavicella sediminum TaxID=2585141 RepID=UPI0011221A2A|nr:hypothetical protein [Flavicella sediminum]
MKNLVQMLFTVLILFSCSSTGDIGSEDSDYSREDAVSSSSKSGDGGGTEPSGNGNQNSEAGIVTAGEWNDLENWDFWNNLNAGFDQENQENKNDYWTIFTNNRISVLVQNSSVAVANAKVELLKNGLPIWTAKTDNFGKAELWIDLFQKNTSVTLSDYQLKVNNEVINTPLKTFDEGVNTIAINTTTSNSNKVEISFIVDATGSMGDEINFLKDDLLDVLNKVKNNNSSKTLLTSSVFYRDEGDDYVTRKSDFSSNITTTISFIKKQNADGGGDYPEAVHSALDVAVNELSWSEDSKTKIAFLLLDAPPHYNTLVIENIQASITKAAAKGIKIIPITASGIDKGTEFLMRFCAILTNGTYTFITNHSGVGNEHIEATVGEYEVEKLNELMVRLINKYSE